MPASKHLRGVAHDLAHHAQSALGWLHPHVARACRSVGALETTFDLLAPDPYPVELPRLEPLRLALADLRVWFLDLLTRLGYAEDTVRAALVTIQLHQGDDYKSAVRATITSHAGRVYAARVDYI